MDLTLLSARNLNRVTNGAGDDGEFGSGTSRLRANGAVPQESIPAECQVRNESIGMNDVFSRLWRHPILLLTCISAGVTTAALITSMAPAVYRARTSIRIEAPDEMFQ